MRLDYATAHIYLQPVQGEMVAMSSEVYRSEVPLGPPAFSLGDVLATGRRLYGNPWLSALQIPRRAVDLFVFFTPDESGLTHSFNAFTAGRSIDSGRVIGEPRLYVEKSTYRGIADNTWAALSQDDLSSLRRSFSGTLCPMGGVIQRGLVHVAGCEETT